VAVDTDVGLTGYGVGGGGLAGVHVVATVLRDLLLDRDPEPVEQIWDEMYAHTLAFGQKGLAIMAVSGVDLALWDLRGQAAQLPVARLLGGQTDVQLPTYTTLWDEPTDEQLLRHRAFKMHMEHQTGQDPVAAVVAAVRRTRTRLGTEHQLMIDAWMRWDVETTLAVDREIQGLGVEWIEEPLPADDLAGYRQLHSQAGVPIAGGEHEFTLTGFQPLIDERLHDILQPDVCWCGGMTQLVQIYQAAQSAGLRVCPHRGAEVWGLHAVAALDQQPLAESGRPWMTWVGGQPPIQDGVIRLTDRPGFGVIIDEDNLPAVSGQA
jgi:L-rhamnonate dehydratase